MLNFAETRVELAVEGAVEASAALDRRLQQIIDEDRFGIRGIASVRLDGVIDWTPSGELMGNTVTDREHFVTLARAARPTLSISPPIVSRLTGDWIITAARSVHDTHDQVTGMVAVAFSPLLLSQLLATASGAPERALVIRYLNDGRIRAAAHDTLARLASGPMPGHPVVLAAQGAETGRLTYMSQWTGRPVLAAFRAVPARNLVAYAAFDQEFEMGPYRQIARPVIVACALYVLCSLLMAFAWDRRSRLRRHLQALASVDPLTGLDNRRSLEERLRHLLPGSSGPGEGFACLLFDLDHFKRVNDLRGHARGDQVLREVARLLRAEVRSGDVVCRWGGEELLVLLRRCDRHQALHRAEALRAAIERRFEAGAEAVDRVTASVGVACFPADGTTLPAITGLADQALYRAKRAGRNRVAMTEPALAA